MLNTKVVAFTKKAFVGDHDFDLGVKILNGKSFLTLEMKRKKFYFSDTYNLVF